MSKNPLQLKSQWSGYFNSNPAVLVITVFQSPSDWNSYNWKAELFWEGSVAADLQLEQGRLMIHEDDYPYDSETAAHRSGERWATDAGFQFEKEIQ